MTKTFADQMTATTEAKAQAEAKAAELATKLGFTSASSGAHGVTVRCLPDGRWFDATRHTWRNGRGRPARWPDLEEAAQMRRTRVILAAAHLDHDPSNNRRRNLKSLCQRCHLIHDRPHHLARRRITYLLRRALGDLFLGPYSIYFGLHRPGSPLPSNGDRLG